MILYNAWLAAVNSSVAMTTILFTVSLSLAILGNNSVHGMYCSGLHFIEPCPLRMGLLLASSTIRSSDDKLLSHDASCRLLARFIQQDDGVARWVVALTGASSVTPVNTTVPRAALGPARCIDHAVD
jgi:hypothetical protein